MLGRAYAADLHLDTAQKIHKEKSECIQENFAERSGNVSVWQYHTAGSYAADLKRCMGEIYDTYLSRVTASDLQSEVLWRFY